MANINELNFKLLVISKNQSEIGKKLDLLKEKQDQVDDILIKQYILLEEKEIAKKIIQFLVGKINTILKDLQEMNQRTRADVEELIKLVHNTATQQSLKRKLGDEEQKSASPSNKRRAIVNVTELQHQQTLNMMQSPSQQEWGTNNHTPRDPRQRFKYIPGPQLNNFGRTIGIREISDLEKINCKIKKFE